MTDPRLTNIAANLPATVPFVGPEAHERANGKPFRARIGANENAFGPSPAAIRAMTEALDGIWTYADPENHDLRNALSEFHRIPADCIAPGPGIDGLFGELVRLYVAPGDPVVTSLGGYPTFEYHVVGYGGTLHRVPYADDREDPGALIEKAREVGAKLIYFSNPNNPMGSWHDFDRVREMIADIPDGSLLVLDEAYIEFAPENTAPRFDTDNPNVIRMRTFSKAYGMAGARVGYAIGAARVISNFDKVRNHFGMNRSAVAGALAALVDQDHLLRTGNLVARARDRIAGIARSNGLTSLPSATNFVAVDCGRDGEFAKAVVAALSRRGVFVRMPFVAPQDRCIRVTAGPDRLMDILAEELPGALEEAGR